MVASNQGETRRSGHAVYKKGNEKMKHSFWRSFKGSYSGTGTWLSRLFFALQLSGMFSLPVFVPTVNAATVEFEASVDQSEITEDDSVALKMVLSGEEMIRGVEPEYVAPDFELVNQYQGTSIRSVYAQGKFQAQNTIEITHLLRPKRKGDLKISKIRMKADGKIFEATDISVKVVAGASADQNVTGTGSPLGNSKIQSAGQPVFLRADVNKTKIFKGEEVLVTYYLYVRGAITSPEAKKWPTLNGFLKEELEMPLAGRGRFNQDDRVVIQGKEYLRILLVRYAAYPVREGRLTIDPLEMKVVHQVEDLRSFYFGGGLMKPLQVKSPPLSVDVLPLPLEGRPAGFTGGVGKFRVTARMDRDTLKVNEAITYTVEVEGDGNLNNITEPPMKWPSDWEVFDTKASSQASASGKATKRIIEFVLIPRAPGKVQLPGIEMSFFDPQQKKYYTEKTPPKEIEVLGVPGGGPGGNSEREGSNSAAEPSGSDSPSSDRNSRGAKEKWSADGEKRLGEPRFLKKFSNEPSTIQGRPIWRYVYWASIFVFFCLFALIVRDHLNRRSLEKLADKAKATVRKGPKGNRFWDTFWTQIKEEGSQKGSGIQATSEDGMSRSQILGGYRKLADYLYERIAEKTQQKISALKGLSFKELEELLVKEFDWKAEDFAGLKEILEKPEWLEFGGAAWSDGTLSEELKILVKKARRIEQSLLS